MQCKNKYHSKLWMKWNKGNMNVKKEKSISSFIPDLCQESLLLGMMPLLVACGNGGRRVSSRVTQRKIDTSLLDRGIQPWLHVPVGTHLEGFLLAPDKVLEGRVSLESVSEKRVWKWVELFNLEERSLSVTKILTLLEKRCVHLSGAENKPLDAGLVVDGVAELLIFDDPGEVRVSGELRQVRPGQRVPEQRLREEDDQRLPELAVHLSSHEVEKRGRRCWVGHLHVAVLVLPVQLLWAWENTRLLVAELQVSLDTSRRVLWTLSIGVSDTHLTLPTIVIV